MEQDSEKDVDLSQELVRSLLRLPSPPPQKPDHLSIPEKLPVDAIITVLDNIDANDKTKLCLASIECQMNVLEAIKNDEEWYRKVAHRRSPLLISICKPEEVYIQVLDRTTARKTRFYFAKPTGAYDNIYNVNGELIPYILNQPEGTTDAFLAFSATLFNKNIHVPMNAILKLLLGIFPGCQKKLSVNVENMVEVRMYEALDGLDEVNELVICGDTLSQDLNTTYILDNIKVTESFICKTEKYASTPGRKSFYPFKRKTMSHELYLKQNPSKHIEVENAFWIRDVLHLQAETIDLQNLLLNVKDIRKMLDMWYDRRNPAFENLKFLRLTFMLPLDVLRLDDYGGTMWIENPEQRPRKYKIKGGTFYKKKMDTFIDCIKGIDMRRPDGVIGTIVHVSVKELIFVVWNRTLKWFT